MKKIIIGIISLFVIVLFIFRVYTVNTAPYLKWLPKKNTYNMGETVPLNSGSYYFTKYDLDGYFVEVTNSKVMKTEAFLESHGETLEFLEPLNLANDMDLICIVTVNFSYKGEENPKDKVVNLEEFQLIGKDYRLTATMEFNQLKDFNPKLKGNWIFAMTDKKEFSVDIPYLIPTDIGNGLSMDYLKTSPPKLLVTYYPDESYLEIQ